MIKSYCGLSSLNKGFTRPLLLFLLEVGQGYNCSKKSDSN